MVFKNEDPKIIQNQRTYEFMSEFKNFIGTWKYLGNTLGIKATATDQQDQQGPQPRHHGVDGVAFEGPSVLKYSAIMITVGMPWQLGHRSGVLSSLLMMIPCGNDSQNLNNEKDNVI